MAHSIEQTKFVEGEYGAVFNQMVESLGEVNFGVKEANASNGYIKAVSGFGLKSYGENIEIYFKQSGDRIEMRIRSACVSPTQIIDFGKNKDNLKKIFGAFGKRAMLSDS